MKGIGRLTASALGGLALFCVSADAYGERLTPPTLATGQPGVIAPGSIYGVVRASRPM